MDWIQWIENGFNDTYILARDIQLERAQASVILLTIQTTDHLNVLSV